MHTINFITNNVDFQKAPKNLIEIIMYQKFLDEKINNVRTRDLRDIKKSLLAELVEFDEETPESHKTWKEKEVDKNMMLEELTDVYFFFSQMINYLYSNNENIFKNKDNNEKKDILILLDCDFKVENQGFTEDKKDLYLDIVEAISKRIVDLSYLLKLLGHFTYLYGYNEETIYNSYYRKWKKNLERIGKEWR